MAVETSLKNYTVQQLHLELIRRYDSKAVPGAAIVEFLRENTSLWLSVIRDELDLVPDPDEPFNTLPLLSKLGRAAENWTSGKVLWFIVPDECSAHELFERGKARGVWGSAFSTMTVLDDESTKTALGIGRMTDKRVMAISLE